MTLSVVGRLILQTSKKRQNHLLTSVQLAVYRSAARYKILTLNKKAMSNRTLQNSKLACIQIVVILTSCNFIMTVNSVSQNLKWSSKQLTIQNY